MNTFKKRLQENEYNPKRLVNNNREIVKRKIIETNKILYI